MKTVNISDNLHKDVKVHTASTNQKLSEFVEAIIQEAINKLKASK